MKCPECGWDVHTQEEWTSGKCNNCQKRERTCTECGEEVEGFEMWAQAGVGTGHKECFEHAKV
jgi:transcriptional regulator NrdR family protein